MKITRRTALATFGGALALPYVRPSWAQAGTVNVYNWADYIGETTLADFEAATGIGVVYDTYTGYEESEAKLLAGSSGYDVVDVAGRAMPRLIAAGVVEKLDRSKLPLWSNLDPDLLKIVEAWDPGVEYGAPYMWGSIGMTYNLDLVKERLPNADLTDLDLVFKPENAALLADCGLSILDSQGEVMPMMLKYLGLDPNSADPADYEKVIAAFAPVRSSIRTFDSENYLNGLPNGEVCAANTWSGDYLVAKSRAAEAGLEINLAYFVPKTGAPIWFDMMVIPTDAPNRANAYAFLDYLMKPEVIAACSNFIGYANANKASREFIDPAILGDPAVYPDAETTNRLWAPLPLSADADRAMTRAWQAIKTN
jgi:putrescine transport system substrate-binding protein